VIPGDNVHPALSRDTLAGGDLMPVWVAVDLSRAPSGKYTGQLLVTDSYHNDVSIPLEVSVKDAWPLPFIVLVLGVATTVIGVWFAITAEDRFAQSEGIDRIAAAVARETGNAEDVVRAALERTLRGDLRVDVGASVWLVVVGGVVLGAGGVLGLVWVDERERLSRSSDPDAVPAVDAGPATVGDPDVPPRG